MRLCSFLRLRFFVYCCALILPMVFQNPSLAAIGEDMEKPAPEFTRSEKSITAKLIPRAKSTSVLIDFTTAQGQLLDVKGIDFETIQTPELDIKEYKSSFFDASVEVSTGSEADIGISSPFFTISTEYWVYNTRKPVKWFNSGSKAAQGNDGSVQFTIRVKDGGDMDADGTANGRIQFIGGPKDYFWSYALGTLIVRFFGIFLVLSMLMIGMMVVGQFFVMLDNKRKKPTPPEGRPAAPQPSAPSTSIQTEEQPSGPDPDMVAAIATALHLHLTPKTQRDSTDANKVGSNAWVQYGRVEIQNTRTQTFLRPIKPNNPF